MIKSIRSDSDARSAGFNEFGKVSSFRSLEDMYEERDNQPGS